MVGGGTWIPGPVSTATARKRAQRNSSVMIKEKNEIAANRTPVTDEVRKEHGRRLQQESRARKKNHRTIEKAKQKDEAFKKDIKEQQHRLFYDDPRRAELVELWNESKKRSPKTWCELLSRVGLHILENGRPADPNLYAVVNLKGLERMLQTTPSNLRPTVLRDPVWYKTRPNSTTSQSWIESLPKTMQVDVQNLGTSLSSRSFGEAISVKEFRKHMARARSKPTMKPMNLLNIASSNQEITPPPLLAYCNMLHQVIEIVRTKARPSVGKAVEELFRDTSLENCLRFQIFGLAGAISGWHMDLLAPITWITLEGNINDERNEEVLKYWAFVDLEGLTTEKKEAALQAFAKEGQLWEPEGDWIRVFSLIRGDTLIMPPGTIHAPITVTDCLFRGGMCWDRRTFVRSTLPVWKFILEHRDQVTNEDPQTQTETIIQSIKQDIKDAPYEYGLKPEESVKLVLGLCDNIAINCTPCNCELVCGSECRCILRNEEGVETRGCFRSCACQCNVESSLEQA